MPLFNQAGWSSESEGQRMYKRFLQGVVVELIDQWASKIRIPNLYDSLTISWSNWILIKHHPRSIYCRSI